MQNVYLIVFALMGFYLNDLACEGRELGSKLRKKNNGEVFYNNFQELCGGRLINFTLHPLRRELKKYYSSMLYWRLNLHFLSVLAREGQKDTLVVLRRINLVARRITKNTPSPHPHEIWDNCRC